MLTIYMFAIVCCRRRGPRDFGRELVATAPRGWYARQAKKD